MTSQRFTTCGTLKSQDGISRRDFINGVLVAASSAAFGCSEKLPTPTPIPGPCDGAIGADPRALRGGNLPATFNLGHILRDRRIGFGERSVVIAGSSCDAVSGSFPIEEDDARYDVIIVGSGISGLSAAFFLTRRRPGTRILILDGNPSFGGNAGRDDLMPIPVTSATGAAYAVNPYNDMLTELYSTIGIDPASSAIPPPYYCYYFDEQTPFIKPGMRGWVSDVYGAGIDKLPYPPSVIAEIKRAVMEFRDWANVTGGPTDPADSSDPRYDYLAQLSFHDWLTKERGFSEAVSDFYTRYTIDALAGTTRQVAAYPAISFLQGETGLFALPGGNEGIARHLVRWLIPETIAGATTAEIIKNPVRTEELDSARHAVRIRQRAMVFRADTSEKEASVIYHQNGRIYRSRGSAVILAGQAHTARHLVEHLATAEQRQALASFVQVPVVVANVALRSAAALVKLGLGYDEYWWGSKYWADFVIADWVTPERSDPSRPTVLTFYGGNLAPPEDMARERGKLLATPFSDYEQSLRDDLGRILAGSGFDFDRDVSGVYVYRWGHGMIFPLPGVAFSPPRQEAGMAVRTPAPRHLARRPIGRIAFAGQDTESTPTIESGIGSGLRTTQEVLPLL